MVAFLEDEAQLMGYVQCPTVVESADKDCGRANQISCGNVRAVADLVGMLVARHERHEIGAGLRVTCGVQYRDQVAGIDFLLGGRIDKKLRALVFNVMFL